MLLVLLMSNVIYITESLGIKCKLLFLLQRTTTALLPVVFFNSPSFPVTAGWLGSFREELLEIVASDFWLCYV